LILLIIFKFINLNNLTLNTLKSSVALTKTKKGEFSVYSVLPSLSSVLSISKYDPSSNNRVTKAFAAASVSENVQSQQQQPSEKTLVVGAAGKHK